MLGRICNGIITVMTMGALMLGGMIFVVTIIGEDLPLWGRVGLGIIAILAFIIGYIDGGERTGVKD